MRCCPAALFLFAACGPAGERAEQDGAASGTEILAPEKTATAPVFQCSGTEPFWGLRLAPGEAVLTQVGAAPEPQETRFQGGWARLDWDAREFLWRGEAGGGTGAPFEATVRGESCQGPRPEAYIYAVRYGEATDGSARAGCCEMTE